MIDIHCHACGGFISDPARISHRLPDDGSPLATPRSGICTCRESVIYGAPSGYAPIIPAMNSAALLN
jgi:hypothetical protein